MSRYSLKPLPERSDIFEVAVGWDPGLETFFVIVFGVPVHGLEPEVRYWSGGNARKISGVEELLRKVENYAILEPELISQLQADQRLYRTKAPLQMSRFISRLLGIR